MAFSTTSNKTSVSMEGLRRGVLYLAPILILAPFFSWMLEAGQLAQAANYPKDSRLDANRTGNRSHTEDYIQALTYHQAQHEANEEILGEIASDTPAIATERSSKYSPIKTAPWLADYDRANEYVSAHVAIVYARQHDIGRDHNPEEWQFARNLTLGAQDIVTHPSDNLLPSVNPIAPLSLFAPPRDHTARTIMLDPGHGGSDPGTVGKQGLLEKHLTLDIARRVQLLLAAHPNMNVVLTRQDDKGYSRKVRMQKVHMTQPDILISLHLNNLPQKDLTLVESYYASRKNILESELGRNHKPTRIAKRSRAAGYPFVKDSKRLADLLQSHLFHQVSQNDPDAINAGTKEDTLFMLTRSYLPATLIELTCLSNGEEEERLKTTEYRQEIAVALAKGILDYFATEHSRVKS